MSYLLSVLSEIGRKQLVSLTVQFSVLPSWFHKFNGAISNVLAVHLFETVQEIGGVGEGDETVAFGFACASVSDNSGHLERGVSPEDAG